MNKYPTIDLQISHLIKYKNIHVSDEYKVERFLKMVPYEKSIKEIKPMLLNYRNDKKKYPISEWDDIEDLYYNYLNQSKLILSDIIKTENKMKAILIYLLQKEDKYKVYITDVPRFMEDNYRYYGHKYNKRKDEIKEFILNEKFYLVINALGFRELINLIFKVIYMKDEVLYNSFIEEFITGDLVLKKVSKMNKKNDIKIFEQPLTFKECLMQSNHTYYNEIVNLRIEEKNSILYEIKYQLEEFMNNIETEIKFTTSSQFLKLKFVIENLLKISISNNKLGNFFYKGDVCVNEMIAIYKKDKKLEPLKINLVAKYVSVSLTLFSLQNAEFSKGTVDSLFECATPGSYIFGLRQKLCVESSNQNLKKYLQIMADVRNSIAHGGTFIIPLFKNHDGDLRLIFVKQYLQGEELLKIKEGRHYYRLRK